jgi:hypothetical protein
MDKYINIAGVWILKEATQSAEDIFSHLEGEYLKTAVKAFKEAIKPPKPVPPATSAENAPQ